jgi:hypothetical protein
VKPLAIPLVVFLAGCPIAPDFPVDAGPDAGDVVITDAGVVDAGATGSVGATLTTSSSVSATSLAWNGSDLESTSIDEEGSTGPQQVTLNANNQVAGNLKMTLGNLTPGATSGQLLQLSYQPASGPDLWTCSATSAVPCTTDVTLTSYDGTTLIGTFSIVFPEDAFGNSAELNQGAFDVILP